MHHPTVTKENGQHHFDVALHLPGLFWPRGCWMFLLWWLRLGFRVIPINSWLVTSGHNVQKFGVTVCIVQHVLRDFQQSCFCSIVSNFGTNFADTLRMAKTSVKMECTEPVLIPTSSASSRTVTRRSCMTKVCTWSVSLSFWLVEHLQARASLSTKVRPSLNRLHHSLICVMPVASSLKTRWIFRMVSTWLSPSFWQNLMQYRCPSRSVIFAENNNAMHAAYTLSHTDCARLTLSAGGKKSMYAHEGTLHLPTTGHLPCFISFRGKKSRRILLEQAMYIKEPWKENDECGKIFAGSQ